MKRIAFIICLLSAMMFSGCRNNSVGDETLIIGKWQVVKTDLYTGNRNETMDMSKENVYWVFTPVTATYYAIDTDGEPYDITLEYKLTRNGDNTLFFTFNGQVYTIEKLNKNEMEWSHTDILGGAAYYDYLKRVQ